MRGKGSNLAYFSKFFDDLCNLYEPHKINSLGAANLLSYRLFSSNDRQFRGSGRNDYNDRRNNNDNNGGGYDKFGSDKYGGRNRGKFDAQRDYDGSRSGSNPGRPMRGERQRDGFGARNVSEGGDFRRQGRRNDGFGKSFGRDGGRGGGKFGDDLKSSGEGSGGLCGDGEERRNYQPSVRDLLNAPSEGEGSGKKVGEDFLAKFRLGSEDEEEKEEKEESGEPLPEEEKMEAPEGADEIFKKMKQSGLIPNAVAMLDGLCKDGLVQEAMKLFGLMREKGSMPEVVVYTAVVEGFCKAQRFDDAKRIFRKMQSNGILPNAFSYTVLIKALSKGKLLDDALNFCSEMVENGHSPNVQTFTGLVHEFCNEKGVEEARKVIITLKQKGFLLDEKAVRVYLDKNGPTAPMVWEAIFGPKKTAQKTA